MIRALVLAAALALGAPAAASAHAVLEGTAPERGATLTESPRQVVLRFSEPVEIAFGAVRVYDARGRDVAAGAATHPRGDDRSVAVPLRPRLPDGGYTVTFRVVSADSHPVSGGFVFSVGEGGPAAAESVSDLLGERRAGPATGVAFAATRALQYAAIALAIGCVAVLLLVWLPALAAEATPGGDWRAASDAFARALARADDRGRGDRSRQRRGGAPAPGRHRGGHERVGRAAGHSAPCSTPASASCGPSAARPGSRCWPSAATRAGGVPALRTATVGAAGIALARTGPWLAAIAVPLLWLACLPGLSGHASVQEPVAVLMPANVLHVAAAGAWIGGLAVLLIALPGATRRLAADRSRALAAALRRFSTLALVAVAALLAGGIVQSLLELSAVRDLVETAYGRAILVKSALVAVLIGCGALNRRRTIPAVSAAAAAGAAPGPSGDRAPAHPACGARARGRRARRHRGARGLLPGRRAGGRSVLGEREPRPGAGRAHGRARARRRQRDPPVPVRPPRRRAVGRHEGADRRGRHCPTAGSRRSSSRARKAGPGHYVVAGAPLSPAGDWRRSSPRACPISTIPHHVHGAHRVKEPMRTPIAATAALLIALAPPAAAGAHVTVQPAAAPEGGFARLDVRVPNERDDQATVKVDMKLPPGVIAAAYEPVPGWSTKVTRERLEDADRGRRPRGRPTGRPRHVDRRRHRRDPRPASSATSGCRWPCRRASPATRSRSRRSRPTRAARSCAGSARRTPTSRRRPSRSRRAARAVATAPPPRRESAASAPAAAATADTGGDDTLAIVALAVGALGLVAGLAGLFVARRRGAS